MDRNRVNVGELSTPRNSAEACRADKHQQKSDNSEAGLLSSVSEVAISDDVPGLFRSCSLASLLSIASSSSAEFLAPEKNQVNPQFEVSAGEDSVQFISNDVPPQGSNANLDDAISVSATDIINGNFRKKKQKRPRNYLLLSDDDEAFDTVKDKFWSDLEKGKLVQDQQNDIYSAVKLLGRKCRPVCLSAPVKDYDDEETDSDPFESTAVRSKVKKGGAIRFKKSVASLGLENQVGNRRTTFKKRSKLKRAYPELHEVKRRLKNIANCYEEEVEEESVDNEDVVDPRDKLLQPVVILYDIFKSTKMNNVYGFSVPSKPTHLLPSSFTCGVESGYSNHASVVLADHSICTSDFKQSRDSRINEHSRYESEQVNLACGNRIESDFSKSNMVGCEPTSCAFKPIFRKKLGPRFTQNIPGYSMYERFHSATHNTCKKSCSASIGEISGFDSSIQAIREDTKIIVGHLARLPSLVAYKKRNLVNIDATQVSSPRTNVSASRKSHSKRSSCETVPAPASVDNLVPVEKVVGLHSLDVDREKSFSCVNSCDTPVKTHATGRSSHKSHSKRSSCSEIAPAPASVDNAVSVAKVVGFNSSEVDRKKISSCDTLMKVHVTGSASHKSYSKRSLPSDNVPAPSSVDDLVPVEEVVRFRSSDVDRKKISSCDIHVNPHATGSASHKSHSKRSLPSDNVPAPALVNDLVPVEEVVRFRSSDVDRKKISSCDTHVKPHATGSASRKSHSKRSSSCSVIPPVPASVDNVVPVEKVVRFHSSDVDREKGSSCAASHDALKKAHLRGSDSHASYSKRPASRETEPTPKSVVNFARSPSDDKIDSACGPSADFSRSRRSIIEAVVEESMNVLENLIDLHPSVVDENESSSHDYGHHKLVKKTHAAVSTSQKSHSKKAAGSEIASTPASVDRVLVKKVVRFHPSVDDKTTRSSDVDANDKHARISATSTRRDSEISHSQRLNKVVVDNVDRFRSMITGNKTSLSRFDSCDALAPTPDVKSCATESSKNSIPRRLNEVLGDGLSGLTLQGESCQSIAVRALDGKSSACSETASTPELTEEAQIEKAVSFRMWANDKKRTPSPTDSCAPHPQTSDQMSCTSKNSLQNPNFLKRLRKVLNNAWSCSVSQSEGSHSIPARLPASKSHPTVKAAIASQGPNTQSGKHARSKTASTSVSVDEVSSCAMPIATPQVEIATLQVEGCQDISARKPKRKSSESEVCHALRARTPDDKSGASTGSAFKNHLSTRQARIKTVSTASSSLDEVVFEKVPSHPGVDNKKPSSSHEPDDKSGATGSASKNHLSTRQARIKTVSTSSSSLDEVVLEKVPSHPGVVNKKPSSSHGPDDKSGATGSASKNHLSTRQARIKRVTTPSSSLDEVVFEKVPSYSGVDDKKPSSSRVGSRDAHVHKKDRKSSTTGSASKYPLSKRPAHSEVNPAAVDKVLVEKVVAFHPLVLDKKASLPQTDARKTLTKTPQTASASRNPSPKKLDEVLVDDVVRSDSSNAGNKTSASEIDSVGVKLCATAGSESKVLDDYNSVSNSTSKNEKRCGVLSKSLANESLPCINLCTQNESKLSSQSKYVLTSSTLTDKTLHGSHSPEKKLLLVSESRSVQSIGSLVDNEVSCSLSASSVEPPVSCLSTSTSKLDICALATGSGIRERQENTDDITKIASDWNTPTALSSWHLNSIFSDQLCKPRSKTLLSDGLRLCQTKIKSTELRKQSPINESAMSYAEDDDKNLHVGQTTRHVERAQLSRERIHFFFSRMPVDVVPENLPLDDDLQQPSLRKLSLKEYMCRKKSDVPASANEETMTAGTSGGQLGVFANQTACASMNVSGEIDNAILDSPLQSSPRCGANMNQNEGLTVDEGQETCTQDKFSSMPEDVSVKLHETVIISPQYISEPAFIKNHLEVLKHHEVSSVLVTDSLISSNQCETIEIDESLLVNSSMVLHKTNNGPQDLSKPTLEKVALDLPKQHGTISILENVCVNLLDTAIFSHTAKPAPEMGSLEFSIKCETMSALVNDSVESMKTAILLQDTSEPAFEKSHLELSQQCKIVSLSALVNESVELPKNIISNEPTLPQEPTLQKSTLEIGKKCKTISELVSNPAELLNPKLSKDTIEPVPGKSSAELPKQCKFSFALEKNSVEILKTEILQQDLSEPALEKNCLELSQHCKIASSLEINSAKQLRTELSKDMSEPAPGKISLESPKQCEIRGSLENTFVELLKTVISTHPSEQALEKGSLDFSKKCETMSALVNDSVESMKTTISLQDASEPALEKSCLELSLQYETVSAPVTDSVELMKTAILLQDTSEPALQKYTSELALEKSCLEFSQQTVSASVNDSVELMKTTIKTRDTDKPSLQTDTSELALGKSGLELSQQCENVSALVYDSVELPKKVIPIEPSLSQELALEKSTFKTKEKCKTTSAQENISAELLTTKLPLDTCKPALRESSAELPKECENMSVLENSSVELPTTKLPLDTCKPALRESSAELPKEYENMSVLENSSVELPKEFENMSVLENTSVELPKECENMSVLENISVELPKLLILPQDSGEPALEKSCSELPSQCSNISASVDSSLQLYKTAISPQGTEKTSLVDNSHGLQKHCDKGGMVDLLAPETVKKTLKQLNQSEIIISLQNSHELLKQYQAGDGSEQAPVQSSLDLLKQYGAEDMCGHIPVQSSLDLLKQYGAEELSHQTPVQSSLDLLKQYDAEEFSIQTPVKTSLDLLKQYEGMDSPQHSMSVQEEITDSGQGLRTLLDLLPLVTRPDVPGPITDEIKTQSVSLHQAVYADDLARVELALRSGEYLSSDLNRPDLETGLTPVMIAAQSGFNAMISVLVQYGARVGTFNPANGNTALIMAAEKGLNETVSLLLDLGAQVNSCNNNRVTALHKAVLGSHEQTVRVLLSNGADVSCTVLADCDNDSSVRRELGVLVSNHLTVLTSEFEAQVSTVLSSLVTRRLFHVRCLAVRDAVKHNIHFRFDPGHFPKEAVEHVLFISIASVECESVKCCLDEAPYIVGVDLNCLKLDQVIPEARCAYQIHSLRPGTTNTLTIYASALPTPQHRLVVCAYEVLS